ncbi:putative sulfate exporter family transporter [Brachybacterium huguangmaarense]|uniref:Sulfate exporter family transporter n=1 Tax=Brachybacterium huguangmaarense TaxID=1652028 RepID=A0ABY6G2M0_9MICO|nr:putative sulfate exporter family transporter [Brachybacterium huguangmaarense]UYG16876.1 putative sulfate exporter family transporter [Brachybacterium huguangmaarense]
MSEAGRLEEQDRSPAPQVPDASVPERPAMSRAAGTVAGAAVVLALATLTRWLTEAVPAAAAGTGVEKVAAAIEYPVYAIALGFAGNAVLTVTGLRGRLTAAFRTELFIKVGLVLLGASIDLAIVVRAAGPAVVQAIVLIAIVFGFTWWFAGRLGLDDRLRALLASALSICGVSAAVAAAGAVHARKEQLAYTATLVIVFAVPSIFLLPFLAETMGLSPAVTGAWIGGNIDTTAAVTAAGAVAGEQPLQIASIVKVTQNALLGVVAVLLTVYFTVRVAATETPAERDGTAAPTRAGARAWLGVLWQRFPKFVLGFLAASALVTVLGQTMPADAWGERLSAAKELQVWALTLAFVSIGLEFNVSSAREAGWRPVLVFAVATVVNLVAGLGLSLLLFSHFSF